MNIKQPSEEQLASLSFIERFSYRCADFCNQRIKEPLIWWNRTFMFSLIWFGLSRRLYLHGLENMEELSNESRVVIAANHRNLKIKTIIKLKLAFQCGYQGKCSIL